MHIGRQPRNNLEQLARKNAGHSEMPVSVLVESEATVLKLNDHSEASALGKDLARFGVGLTQVVKIGVDNPSTGAEVNSNRSSSTLPRRTVSG